MQIFIVKRLNTATLDELQNVICCSNYRRDYKKKESFKYKSEPLKGVHFYPCVLHRFFNFRCSLTLPL
jgi:hypothetical protein